MKDILLERLLKKLHKNDLTFILKNKTNQKLKKTKTSMVFVFFNFCRKKPFGDSLNYKANKSI